MTHLYNVNTKSETVKDEVIQILACYLEANIFHAQMKSKSNRININDADVHAKNNVQILIEGAVNSVK